MKTQSMRLVGGEGSVLTVTLGWRENALREPLRWITNLQSPQFARVRLEEKNDRVKAMHYSFAGSKSLAEVLAAPLQPYRFQLLLTALAEAEALRAQSSYPDFILSDPKCVFLTDGGVPCFAYVPLDSAKARARMGLLNLLKALSDKRVRFADPAEEAQRAMLASYVETLGSNPDFALFAAFLRDGMGFPLQATTRQILEELGQREAERERARSVDVADVSTEDQSTTGERESAGRGTAATGGASWRGVSARGSYDAFLMDGVGGRAGDTTDGGPDSGELPREVVPLALLRVSTGDVLSVPAEGGTVGRSSQCAIRILGNPKVGREHAQVTREDDQLVVRDLGAQNGTWFDGKPLLGEEVAHLGVGQTFNVADEQLRVVRSDVFHA